LAASWTPKVPGDRTNGDVNVMADGAPIPPGVVSVPVATSVQAPGFS